MQKATRSVTIVGRIQANDPAQVEIWNLPVQNSRRDFGVYVYVSTICRMLKTMGYTREVMHRVALLRSEKEWVRFMADVSLYDLSNYRQKYGY